MALPLFAALVVVVAGWTEQAQRGIADQRGQLHETLMLESQVDSTEDDEATEPDEEGGLSLQPGGFIASYVTSSWKLAQDIEERMAQIEKGASVTKMEFVDAWDSADLWFLCKALVSGAFLGVVFGMMGAGGSLILKPLLFYGFGVRPFKDAIFHGYIILFLVAFVSAAKGQRKGLVHWKNVAMLACLTSGFGAFLGSLLASMVSSKLQLTCFASLMLGVALHMLHQSRGSLPLGLIPMTMHKDKGHAEDEKTSQVSSLTVLMAVTVGIISGFTGIGGGFLLVPLLCQCGQQMDTAVPTSQAVVALSCLFGCFFYISILHRDLYSVHLSVITCLVVPGLAGIMLTDYISNYVSKSLRQQLYALMLICVGTGTVVLQVI